MSKASDLINQINKQMKGDGLQSGGDSAYEIEYIPTGLLPMDALLEGGIPKGRITLLYGAYSTAKSLLAYMAIKQCQDAGGVAALYDSEHAYEREWAVSLGINVDDLILIEAEIAEEGLDYVEMLLRSKQVDLIVIDSITSLVPKGSYDRPLMDNERQAALAGLMSRASKKLNAALPKNTALLWLSQTRTNIGMSYGPTQEASGGKSIGFYSSVMINMAKIGKEQNEYKVHTGGEWTTAKETVVQKFKAELTKSKLSKPFKQAYFNWNLVTADFDIPAFCVQQGLDMGLVKQSGAWWSYTDIDADTGEVGAEVKGQGMEKFKAALVADKEQYNKLIQRVCDKFEINNIYGVN